MGMSEYQHQVEGQLVCRVRRTIVALDKMAASEFIQHRMTVKELEGRRDDLRLALREYEEMMEERDDDE